jgi:hypothetical protein
LGSFKYGETWDALLFISYKSKFGTKILIILFILSFWLQSFGFQVGVRMEEKRSSSALSLESLDEKKKQGLFSVERGPVKDKIKFIWKEISSPSGQIHTVVNNFKLLSSGDTSALRGMELHRISVAPV